MTSILVIEIGCSSVTAHVLRHGRYAVHKDSHSTFADFFVLLCIFFCLIGYTDASKLPQTCPMLPEYMAYTSINAYVLDICPGKSSGICHLKHLPNSAHFLVHPV